MSCNNTYMGLLWHKRANSNVIHDYVIPIHTVHTYTTIPENSIHNHDCHGIYMGLSVAAVRGTKGQSLILFMAMSCVDMG